MNGPVSTSAEKAFSQMGAALRFSSAGETVGVGAMVCVAVGGWVAVAAGGKVSLGDRVSVGLWTGAD